MKRFFAGLAVVVFFVIFLVGLFIFKAFVNTKIAYAISHMPPPSVTVSTARVTESVWKRTIQSVASLNAVQGTNITAQIAGNVIAINFHSGQKVKAGQRLLTVDDTTQLAQLRADEANESLASINVKRTKKLIAHRAAAQSQLDTYEAALANVAAIVGQDKATLAKLNITAPFSGYLGIRQVSLGQYLASGTAITVINKWNPIFADFNIPQNEFPVLKVGRKVMLRVDAYPKIIFRGKIQAISSNFDPNSRTVQVQAEFANKRLLLRPGMFGTVKVDTGLTSHYETVPDVAVSYNTYGDFVYRVINKRPAASGSQTKPATTMQSVQTVEEVPVVVGPQVGNLVAILSGLKVGQTIVTAGQIKLHPGAVIKINNQVQP